MRLLTPGFRRVFTFQPKETEVTGTPPDTELLRGTIKITAVAQVVIATAAAMLNATVTTIIFWYVGLPYFYFLGIISAFLGLVPYLGLFFALFAPIAAGMGVLTKGQLLIVFVTVILLHLLGMNLLYPKLIGRRLRLNPLAVAMSLLFWGWSGERSA